MKSKEKKIVGYKEQEKLKTVLKVLSHLQVLDAYCYLKKYLYLCELLTFAGLTTCII